MGQYGTVQKRRFQDGVERWTWEKRVPRIPDELTRSIVGLYRSVEDAEEQKPESGGSGFITAVNDDSGATYLYAVTNRHVVHSAPVLRIHATKQVLDLTENDWHFETPTPDLAVYLLDIESPLIQPIHRGHFLSINPSLQQLNVGTGDDVFMVGRYHPAERFDIREPTARFGNIAAWPSHHIVNHLTGVPEECFLVEMRSRNGCSGSPVFVSVEANSPRPVEERLLQSTRNWKITGMSPYFMIDERRIAFLGVDWGHLPDKDTLMALVVPDHQLVALLDSKELMEQRKELREKKSKEKPQASVVLDYQDGDSFTKEDFENALKKVSRKLNSEGSDRK